MNSNSLNFRKSAELLAVVCGSLLMSVPAFAQTSVMQQASSANSKVNPCPSIFYEPQHTNRVLVPQGCPPNALTQRMQSQGTLPYNSVPTTPSADPTRMGIGGESPYGGSQQPSQTGSNIYTTPQSVPTQPDYRTEPSLRQQGQSPVATVALANGNLNIRLVNETGANITYQVIGNTDQRSLQGKRDVILQGLRAPLTVTFQRADGGLLLVTPQPSSETGLLEVRLDETTDVGQDAKAMRVQSNGSIWLN